MSCPKPPGKAGSERVPPSKKAHGFVRSWSILACDLSRLPAPSVGRLRGALFFRCSAQPSRLFPHRPVLRRRVVIPPAEVEEAVGEQHRQLVERRPSSDLRLAHGRGNGDDDVTKEQRVEGGELAFPLRECEDVGCFVFMTIDMIELVDLFVIDKCN